MPRRASRRGGRPAPAGLITIIICLCLPGAAFAAAVASASGQRLRQRAGQEAAAELPMPTQGIFESCPLDSMLATCVQRLDVIRQAGLKVVAEPAGGTSLGALAQYAQAAQSLGLSVMWELSNPIWWREPPTGTGAATSFGAFASACGCQDNADVLAYTIGWLAGQPATYGYYAADDSMIAPGDEGGVTSYVSQIKQRDPAHVVMIGTFQDWQRRALVGAADLIGQEVYPVTTQSLMPQADHPDMWAYVRGTIDAAQQDARQAGKGTAFILQAFTWGDNVADGTAIGVCSQADSTASCDARLRYPAGAEQLALRNAVIRRARPRLIMWWSFQGTYGRVPADDSFADPGPAGDAARWAGLTSAIDAAAPLERPQQASPRQLELRNRARARLRARLRSQARARLRNRQSG